MRSACPGERAPGATASLGCTWNSTHAVLKLHGKAGQLLAAIRRNPRADWRIEQLKAIADRYSVSYRQPGTSHLTFRSPRGDKLAVPARRPIQPVYIGQFLALLEALETGDDDRT